MSLPFSPTKKDHFVGEWIPQGCREVGAMHMGHLMGKEMDKADE